ncbi:MAG: O-antigen ligase family protein [Vicinamibacterales bacterium]
MIRGLAAVQRGCFAALAAVVLLALVRFPGAVSLVWAALAAVTAAAPVPGLLIVAAFAPIGVAIGSLAGTPPWTEPIVLAFIAGAAARAALQRRPVAWTIPWPALVLAIAIASSAVVELALMRVRMGPDPFRALMFRLLEGHYFGMLPELGPLTAATLFLEGLALFVAVAAIVGPHRDRLRPFISMTIAGAVGAAALNLTRLATAAVSTGDGWPALMRVSRTTRINMEYGDVNAAGSYFAMLLCLAVGLALMTTRRARLATTVSAVVVGLALWLTSSRAAILGVLVVGGLSAALPFVRTRPPAPAPLPSPPAGTPARRRVPSGLLGVAGLTMATLLVLLFLPNRLIGGNATAAAEIRRDMAIVSWRLLATRPVFGVGIGQYYELSGDEMLRLPVGRTYIRQNAHNNYLQILAELGVAGFACFAGLLWLAGRGLWGASRTPAPGGVPPGALAAGLGAFLFSALFGHPLLAPACAYAFWMVAGAAAGFAPRSLRPIPYRALAAIAGAVILISTPLRAKATIDGADLDHLGYGLSLWEMAGDGQRYRVATGTATIFIPSDAAVVKVPLRTSGGATRHPVSIRLRGRLVDRLTIEGTAWTWYKFTVPQHERARFVPLQLELEEAPGEQLHVGKVSVVTPRDK